MKLAINQPYFFPYIGYFQLIESVDKFVIHGGLKFVKQTWVNRNRLLGRGSNDPFYIMLPVEKKIKKQLIENVRISKAKNNWLRKTQRTLTLNYAKAKYFEETNVFLMDVLNENEFCLLQDFNTNTIKKICTYLSIDTDIVNYNQLGLEVEKDLITLYDSEIKSPPIIEKKTMRALKYCELLNVSTFHNLSGGRELYDKEVFKKYGFDLEFIDIPNIDYQQFGNDFIPHLSIIDVLMHNGREGTLELIKNYKLV